MWKSPGVKVEGRCHLGQSRVRVSASSGEKNLSAESIVFVIPVLAAGLPPVYVSGTAS